MASITSTVGLASGIDSKAIIDQLMRLEEQPKTRLQARIETENKKKAAYTDLQTRLTSIRLFGTTMKKPQSFRNASVASTDEKILTGTASAGAAAGSYTMSVARLVSARQSLSKGFSDVSTKPVGAGTLTLELGGGDLNVPTALDDLNGGDGVRRGKFRITDRSGESTVIDIGDAVTVDDVLKKINTSLDVSVKATIKNDAIVLTDQSGSTANNLRIEDIGDGHAAEDLGIKQNVAADSMNGSSLIGLSSNTKLASLNDGRGVFIRGNNQPDFTITYASGVGNVDISLTGATTIGDVVSKINTALGSNGHADIVNGALAITDAGGGTIAVTPQVTSTGAQDLGLGGTHVGTITGTALISGLDTTLVSSLRGGKGLDLGVIRMTDRSGVSADVDLSGATTVAQIIQRINDANGTIEASVKSGGNGIQLTDTGNGSGAITISDTSGQAAAQMGIAGTFAADSAHQTINGANLQKAWFGGGTLLKNLNGGKGVPEGKFVITDSTGKTRTISIDPTKDTTVSAVMEKINVGTTFGVKASINANGDGLLLTDTAGGSLKMKVEESNNGSTAKALNIVGTAATTTIDGTWEKTVTITATDKLQDVQTKIQNAGWGLSAGIINDGSDDAPYRLSLTSTATGRAGRVVFDSGAVNLGERVLVDAQDAAVFVGSDDATGSGGEPMLITANSNTISGAIRGVTLNLQGVSKEPVTVNVARNVDNVVESMNKMVEDFNGLMTQLKTYTKYDSATQTRGELLGDPAASSIEGELYGMLNTVGNASGKYRIAADVGVTIGDQGMIEFDEEKFRAAYADDPEAVTTLFTRAGAAISDDFKLGDLRNNQGLRTNATGVPDFNIATKDGTNFNVDVSDLTTMGQLIDAINNATGNDGKVIASINSLGTGIDLVDKSTTGTKKFLVSTMNGSIAASDLGLLTTATNGKITGKSIVNSNSGDNGGIASIIEKRINRLIDPTIGVVTKASSDIDDRNTDFTRRIESIDELVANKRARMEKQFADMESSLSKLQSQQSALNSYTPVSFK